MAKKTYPWIVLGGARGESAHCQRCGVGMKVNLPQTINVLVGAMKGFEKDHRDCQDTGRVEPEPAHVEDWLAGRDTGISSLTLCSAVTGYPYSVSGFGRNCPQDPSDFGRCYLFIKLFPQYRKDIGKVIERCPQWAPFVEHWDELCEMYEAALATGAGQADALYDRMRELRKSVQR